MTNLLLRLAELLAQRAREWLGSAQVHIVLHDGVVVLRTDTTGDVQGTEAVDLDDASDAALEEALDDLPQEAVGDLAHVVDRYAELMGGPPVELGLVHRTLHLPLWLMYSVQ
jgi:hypothetical protein